MTHMPTATEFETTWGGEHDGVFRLPEDFLLEHGARPAQAEVAFSLVGRVGAPVVAVFGGISAGRHVAASVVGDEGWWAAFAGPGRAIDTEHYQVLSFDFVLPHAEGSDVVTSCDQARVLAQLLDHLDIRRLRSVVGSSYGGMVALAFAADFPNRLERVVVLNAAHKASPMSTAWRSIQRKMVRLAKGTGQEIEFLQLARQLAMTTYRSVPEFKERFDAPAEISGDSVEFPVESYLEACGAKWSETTGVDKFLALSQSIDLHRVDPARISVPALVIACLEDLLIPIEDARELAVRLGGQTQIHEFSSIYGHDSFLKNTEELSPVLRRYIGERNDQAA